MSSLTIFNILDLANYPGLVETTASHLDPGSIIALSRTCRAFSEIYPHLVHTQWNVDRRLRRFVRDPRALRAELGRRNGLISGGFACQFFDRALWPESDLDLWARDGDDAAGLVQHFVQRESYSLQKKRENDGSYDTQSDDPDDLHDQLAAVTTLHKKNTAGEILPVQVVSTKHTPLLAILRHFYSNIILNVISSTRAYALFPAETFVKRRASYFDNFEKPSIAAGMKKYLHRGFTPRPYDTHGPTTPFGNYRRVGDQHTWILPLADYGNDSSSRTLASVLEYSKFRVDLPLKLCGSSPPDYHRMRAMLFVACPLMHEYACTGEEGDSFWLQYVGPYLDQLTAWEFDHQSLGDVPAHWINEQPRLESRNTHRYRNSFKTWKNFKYFDNDIPRWFASWEKATSEGSTLNPFATLRER